MITLTDGTQIEYHASFNFPRHTFLKMKQEGRGTLKRERAAYRNQNGGTGRSSTRSEIQELRTQIQELVQGSTVSPPTDTVSVRSQVSQVTTNSNSIMGGRNEQAQARNARRTAAIAICYTLLQRLDGSSGQHDGGK